MVGIKRAIATGGTIETEQIHLVDALEDAVTNDFGRLTRPFLRLCHIKDKLSSHPSCLGVVARVDVHFFARGTAREGRCTYKGRQTHHDILETILHI